MALYERQPYVPPRREGELPSEYVERIARVNGWARDEGETPAPPAVDPRHAWREPELPEPYNPDVHADEWTPFREDE